MKRPIAAIASVLAVVLVAGIAFVATRGDESTSSPTTEVASSGPTSAPASASTSSDTTSIPAPTTTAQSSDTTTSPATTPAPTTTTELTADTPDELVVLDYLAALAEGRYEAAAKLLGEGGLELEARADLRPLFNRNGTLASLAAALETWCLEAICDTPVSVDTVDSRVLATFDVEGIERTASFVASTFEGSPLVAGLPLQRPTTNASFGDTIACPTREVVTTLYADLDGDNWFEIITVRTSISGAFPYVVGVCGSPLSVAPVETSLVNGPARVYALDVEDDGSDELFIGGSADAGLAGSVFGFDGVDLLDTHRQVVMVSPAADGTPGTSFGCVDVDLDGARDFAGISYAYVGGTDLSNSTELTATITQILLGGARGATTSASFALPRQIDDAFLLIGGYCGPLQIQTG